MAMTVETYVGLLGRWGFSAKCIVTQVRKNMGRRLERWKVYRVLRLDGIRLRDYRDGKNTQAKSVLPKLVRPRVKVPA